MKCWRLFNRLTERSNERKINEALPNRNVGCSSYANRMDMTMANWVMSKRKKRAQSETISLPFALPLTLAVSVMLCRFHSLCNLLFCFSIFVVALLQHWCVECVCCFRVVFHFLFDTFGGLVALPYWHLHSSLVLIGCWLLFFPVCFALSPYGCCSIGIAKWLATLMRFSRLSHGNHQQNLCISIRKCTKYTKKWINNNNSHNTNDPMDLCVGKLGFKFIPISCK